MTEYKVKNKKGLLERLKNSTVLGAEGYLFELERRGYVKAGPFVPEVVIEYPEAVKELHMELLRAGAEVMVALTYYAHREKMKTIGRELDVESLNRQALRLAGEVAEEGDSLFAGNLSNTCVYDPDNHSKSVQRVQSIYEEQILWASEAGVDFVIAQTLEYLAEAVIALKLIKKYNLPAMITFSSVTEKTKDGYVFEEACKILEKEGADVVGLNCSRGPSTMLPLIEKIRNEVTCYVAAQPVAYRTTKSQPTFQSLKINDNKNAFPVRLEPFQLTRYEMAHFARKARELGINYIGVCCGGAPHHVREMAAVLEKDAPALKYSYENSLQPGTD